MVYNSSKYSSISTEHKMPDYFTNGKVLKIQDRYQYNSDPGRTPNLLRQAKYKAKQGSNTDLIIGFTKGIYIGIGIESG